MTVEWYDRQGNPITIEDYERLRIHTPDYYRVALTEIGGMTISTVWLGLDHSWHQDGPPVIFETMVFGDGMVDLDCARYCTETQAIAGHDQMVAHVQSAIDQMHAIAEAITETSAGDQ